MKEHLIIRDLLTLSAAGILSPAEERRVQEHLRQCAECRAELDVWTRIAGSLNELPIPQASPRLVIQTKRLVYQAVSARKTRASRVGLALLVVFSWMVAFMSVEFFKILHVPLARWLDVSSTTVWVAYVGVTWLATALAAGLLGKRWQQEGRTV